MPPPRPSFFPIAVARAIQGVVNMLDMHLRDQSHAGVIANERDYASSFAVLFRTLMRILCVAGLEVECRINTDAFERKTGTDIMFRFHRNGRHKILLAEAKLVRALKGAPWDRAVKTKTKPKRSHFDEQLVKQAAFITANPGAAVVELFFLDAPLGTTVCGLHPYGSTCFMHQSAVHYRFSPSTPLVPLALPWKRHDLTRLASHYPFFNLGEAVFRVCKCDWGNPTDGEPGIEGKPPAVIIDVRYNGEAV